MKYEITALRLREALGDANMTQQELADKAHIGKSSISHYINGTNEPGNKSAYQIAKVLKVNPAWLMGLDAPKKNPEDVRLEIEDMISQLSEGQRHHIIEYIKFILQRGGNENVVDNE